MRVSKNVIYYVCLLTCVVVNMDHGVIPACTWELKSQLQVDDLFIGILGSLVFAGLMIGSIVR